MRIVIDARFYGPFGKGLGRYVQKLITHLEPIVTSDDVVVLLRKENFDAYVPASPRFTRMLANFRWYSVEEQRKLPPFLRSLKPDLVHFPHYNVPLLYRGPFVVTVHDLILSSHPTERATTLGPLRYAVKHFVYERVIRSAIRRARTVLTVSHYSKRQIVERFAIAPDRVVVTHEAAEPLAIRDVPPAVASRHQALVPYLLYVGNAYPHKNLEGLLRAIKLLLERRADGVSLVLVGKMDYFFERLRREADALGLSKNVVFTGYVSDEELASLYWHAMLYVFPSFEEGFGLPALEAMIAGVPVASSNQSCLPEILGDAAAYFDPHRPEAIAATIGRLLDHPEERSALRARGAEQVRKYAWGSLARSTYDVYTRAIHETRHPD